MCNLILNIIFRTVIVSSLSILLILILKKNIFKRFNYYIWIIVVIKLFLSFTYYTFIINTLRSDYKLKELDWIFRFKLVYFKSRDLYLKHVTMFLRIVY
ncbi:membrane-associated metalloprotease,M56 family [Clostridioides difficile]|nr:membrane-associated metalloprotease,M56 family [Clostridioides difficile]VIG18881.1 membrane-associated metalloprotease,M56 family [Clostridioides difficile]